MGKKKLPVWNTTATVGLFVLILLTVLGFAAIADIIGGDEKVMVDNTGVIPITLTAEQKNRIIGLVGPLVDMEASDFTSIEKADKNQLVSAAIMSLLSEDGRKYELIDSGDIVINERDVASRYDTIFGQTMEVPDDYINALFSYDSVKECFYAQYYSGEEAMPEASDDLQDGETTSSEENYVEYKLENSEKTITVDSSRRESEKIIVTVFVYDNAQNDYPVRKLDVVLKSDADYVITAMMDI